MSIDAASPIPSDPLAGQAPLPLTEMVPPDGEAAPEEVLPEGEVASEEATAPPPRPYALVLFGASGFVGRQAAQYLAQHADMVDRPWAIAGRNRSRLEAVQARCSGQVPDIVLANSRDTASLETVASCTDVLLSTAGPFAVLGNELVAACVRQRRPLVSGAAIGFDGQVSVYDTRDPAAPCYACIFPPAVAVQDVACATMGVFAPLVGIIGSVQAAEALKLLAGVGSSLAGRLQMLDARCMQWDQITLPRHPDCPVCAPHRPASASG